MESPSATLLHLGSPTVTPVYGEFEDGCALAGRLSREKYEGSYEQLAATLTSPR